jgi:hypothetical protein
MNPPAVGSPRCDPPARAPAGGSQAPLNAARTAQRAVPTHPSHRFMAPLRVQSWRSKLLMNRRSFVVPPLGGTDAPNRLKPGLPTPGSWRRGAIGESWQLPTRVPPSFQSVGRRPGRASRPRHPCPRQTLNGGLPWRIVAWPSLVPRAGPWAGRPRVSGGAALVGARPNQGPRASAEVGRAQTSAATPAGCGRPRRVAAGAAVQLPVRKVSSCS